ncbi:hypothetical protein JCM11641_005226 [Rhodosporidiobolus odoratus]
MSHPYGRHPYDYPGFQHQGLPSSPQLPRPRPHLSREERLRRFFPQGCIVVGSGSRTEVYGSAFHPPTPSSSGPANPLGGSLRPASIPRSAPPPLHWPENPVTRLLNDFPDTSEGPAVQDKGKKRARIPEDDQDEELRDASLELVQEGRGNMHKRRRTRGEYAHLGEHSAAGASQSSTLPGDGPSATSSDPVRSSSSAHPKKHLSVYIFPLPATLSRAQALDIVHPFFPPSLQLIPLETLIRASKVPASLKKAKAMQVELDQAEAEQIVVRGQKGEVVFHGAQLGVERHHTTDEAGDAQNPCRATTSQENPAEGNGVQDGGLGRSARMQAIAPPAVLTISSAAPLPLSNRIAMFLSSHAAHAPGLMGTDKSSLGKDGTPPPRSAHALSAAFDAPNIPPSLGALPPTPSPAHPHNRFMSGVSALVSLAKPNEQTGSLKNCCRPEEDVRKLREVKAVLEARKASGRRGESDQGMATRMEKLQLVRQDSPSRCGG